MDRARAEQDLGVREGLAGFSTLDEFHADGAAIVDDDPGRARADLGLQIGARQGGMQIGGGRAPAASVTDGELIGAKALLLETIEIAGLFVASLNAGGDEAGIDRVLGVGLGDMQRALGAMPGVPSPLQALGTFEIGEHIAIAPAGEAHLAPLVIVAGMAADVDHAVDGGGAAPTLAARPPERTIIEVRLGLGPEAPIVVALGGDQAADAGGHAHEQGIILAAGFEEQDLDLGVFA